ncbi:dolichyl-phosphate-mannose-protein mannosyltransferase [Saccharomycopsis crataegensis]|uniref:Dolichyl-phosphate-mannose--protein mannosyltransferase n=1 Tax=Saccharomycopsis crataegensis TaxID=43959 RepID=A0AAV5QK49_9ASCO|nr:dolichyl-phosphate-mannose-protein mannosyltransferase [Saccharomycopsis crataegensis]
MAPQLKKKGSKAFQKPLPKIVDNDDPEAKNKALTSKSSSTSSLPDAPWMYQVGLYTVTILAFITRFYSINYPDEVVFDEVHFGKFASYYLQRTYFFDLHPPFAKLLIAFAGWIIGYDGKFKFENIGDNYITNNVPYIAYRTLSAIQGTITIPIVYLTMKQLNYRVITCLFASSIVLFDNAHVAETRLILLDATLNLTVALSIYCYVKFSKQRHQPFSVNWWKWLFLTGVSLSLVISTKYVGVFTFLMVGLGVFIELWNILDYRQGHTIKYFGKHFGARVFGLIVLPFVLYLSWFWIHFAVLTRSGPGDAFMSPEFQETLADSPLAKDAKEIFYYDSLTVQHKDTEAFLHSHEATYPLRYDDGRISSQGQQVTGYKGEEFDPNNYWQILPAKDFKPEEAKGKPVKLGDTIRLYHPATKSFLLTHDVASPFYPTNEEFTTIDTEKALGDKYNYTLFKLESHDKKGGKLKTKASIFRLLHIPTVVAMWTHDDKLLPEWGFNQQEVNGNKKVADGSNLWFFNTIASLTAEDPRSSYVPKKIRHIPFLKKWFELQRLMFYHNNKLSSEHPFASSPESWPFSLSGVSFWTKDATREQIYFIGNIIGYWIEVSFIFVFIGLVIADQLTQRRNYHPLSDSARNRLYNTLGFFFLGWCAHYFPFFLMGRQKFLHHYMPAHLIAAEFSGAVFEFVFSDNRGPDLLTEAEKVETKKSKSKITEVNKLGLIIGFLVLTGAIIWCFVFFAPLTYGNRGLSVEEVLQRKWLNMSLHFAK